MKLLKMRLHVSIKKNFSRLLLVVIVVFVIWFPAVFLVLRPMIHHYENQRIRKMLDSQETMVSFAKEIELIVSNHAFAPPQADVSFDLTQGTFPLLLSLNPRWSEVIVHEETDEAPIHISLFIGGHFTGRRLYMFSENNMPTNKHLKKLTHNIFTN